MPSTIPRFPQNNSSVIHNPPIIQPSGIQKNGSPSIPGGLPFLNGSLPFSNYHPVEFFFQNHKISNYPHIADFIHSLYSICSQYPEFSLNLSPNSSKADVISDCLTFLNTQEDNIEVTLSYDEYNAELHILSEYTSENLRILSFFPLDYLPALGKANPALFNLFLSFLRKIYNESSNFAMDEEYLIEEIAFNRGEMSDEINEYFDHYKKYCQNYYTFIRKAPYITSQELLHELSAYSPKADWEKTLISFIKEGIELHENHNFYGIDTEIIDNHEAHRYYFDLEEYLTYKDFLTNIQIPVLPPSSSFSFVWGLNETSVEYYCSNYDCLIGEGYFIPISTLKSLTPQSPFPETKKLIYDHYTEYFTKALDIHELLTEVFSHGNSE